jgi:hypothetical protein
VWGVAMHPACINSDDLWVQINFVGRGATFFQGLCDNKLPEKYNKNLIFWADSCLEEMSAI